MKKIKGNSGNPADYGSDTYKILRDYSHDIMGVLEPVNGGKYYNLYSQQLPIAKECAQIRERFSKIDPANPESEMEYEKINKRILELLKKVEALNSAMDRLDLSQLSDTQVKLQSTYIEKLTKLENEICNLCWDGGHDGGALITTEDFYFSDKYDEIWDGEVEHPYGNQCVDNFDTLAELLTYDTHDKYNTRDIGIKYMKKCKFAINPNSKLAKK